MKMEYTEYLARDAYKESMGESLVHKWLRGRFGAQRRAVAVGGPYMRWKAGGGVVTAKVESLILQYMERNPIGLGLSIGSMGLDHHDSIGLE